MQQSRNKLLIEKAKRKNLLQYFAKQNKEILNQKIEATKNCINELIQAHDYMHYLLVKSIINKNFIPPESIEKVIHDINQHCHTATQKAKEPLKKSRYTKFNLFLRKITCGKLKPFWNTSGDKTLEHAERLLQHKKDDATQINYNSLHR